MSENSSDSAAASDAPSNLDERRGGAQDISWGEAGPVVASGFAMGSADVVPGVSGGTMAVACGIYGKLLAAIGSINPISVRALLRFDLTTALGLIHFRFLLSLAGGLAAAVVVMIKIIGLPRLLLSHPELVYGLFFGLVAASIFVLGRKVKWGPACMAALAGGAILGLGVVTLVPMDMPGSPPFMFLYGVISISAMLLPGISGSFILLILGQYERVILAIEDLLHFDFSALAVVVPFALGCLTGLIAFSRFVAWLLSRFFHPVMAGLCGLLLGSLWRIWPFQETVTRQVHGKLKVIKATPIVPETWDVFPLLLIVLGFGLVFLIEFLAKTQKKTPPGVSPSELLGGEEGVTDA